MNRFGCHARGFRQTLRRPARQRAGYPHALMKKPLTLEQYLSARTIADPLPSFRLRHALRGRRGVSGHARRDGKVARPALRAPVIRHRATQCLSGRSNPDAAGWIIDRDELYGMAGVTTGEIDFVQTYDDDLP